MRRSRVVALALAGAVTAAGQAQAGAFALREGSAAAQGASWAGRTSGDRDVSFALHNPAALRSVDHIALSTGMSVGFGERTATMNRRLIPGTSLSDDALDKVAFIPGFVAGWRVHEKVVLGLAAQSSFGAVTRYGDDFGASFAATDTKLMSVAVTPMIAVEPVPGFSIGGGVTLQYAQAEFGNFIPAAPPFAQSVKGAGLEVSARLGVLADVTESTTLGAAIHLGYDYDVKADYSAPYRTLAGSILFTPAKGRAAFSLPAVVSAGVTHRVSDDFRVMAEVEWTDWSVFDKIEFTAGGASAGADNTVYEDTFFAAIGAEYDLNDRLTLRGGLGFDQTPTTDAHRTPRVPDGDRILASIGASYQVNERYGLDAAYTYVHVMDSDSIIAGGAARLKHAGSAHLFSVNLRANF